MRFVFLDSRFTLRASFPRSVTLTQLRFTSLAVVSSQADWHLQDRAHAGRTNTAALDQNVKGRPEHTKDFYRLLNNGGYL